MRKILTGLVFIASFVTFSQSNNIDFSMAFVTNPAFTAGLDESSKQGAVFQISVSLNENTLNSLGTLDIVIYDQSASVLMTKMTLNQQQILSGAYTSNGQLVFNFPYLNPEGKYKVILDIQNVRQAYLPRVEKNFPAN